jgi:hypothetical protein
MDDIDKLKELRLIQNLESLNPDSIEERNESEFSENDKIEIKDIINQLIPNVDNSSYIFIEQWSPFGFVIHYSIYYKSKKVFDLSEHYLPKGYDRNKMDEIILGEINACKFKYFLNEMPRKLSDVDY